MNSRLKRLIKCCKGAGLSLAISSFPFLIVSWGHHFTYSDWRRVLLLGLLFLAMVIAYEIVIRKYIPGIKLLQGLVLSTLFFIIEIGFYDFIETISMLNYNEMWIIILLILISVFPSGLFTEKYLFPKKKSMVIIEHDVNRIDQVF